MKKVPFRSGVHPKGNKAFSADEPIRKIEPGDILLFPMSQHIGAPATPVVKAGDAVLVGIKIADATSFVSSPIHSSVSGIVKSVENRRMPDGRLSECVVIENDHNYTAAENYGKENDLDALSVDEIKKIISDSGIVGLGGAGFPTGVKIAPKNSEYIDYVIINGAECEPYLTSDYRVMIEKTENVIAGLSIALRLFPNAEGVIAIEDNKPDAISVMQEKTQKYPRISVQSLKTKYPQGAERRLIASVTGRKINSHLLPADAGVVVLNASTACSIYDAVFKNIPLVRRIITVTGDGVNAPCNLDVAIGDNVADIIEKCGGIKDNTKKLISGGPMMGKAVHSLDIPVTKTFSSVLALLNDDVENMKISPCIRCGRCVNVCPETLVPQMLAQASKNNDFESFEKLGGMECIECGSCSYVCPAKRPLTQSFKLAKAAIKANKVKKEG